MEPDDTGGRCSGGGTGHAQSALARPVTVGGVYNYSMARRVSRPGLRNPRAKPSGAEVHRARNAVEGPEFLGSYLSAVLR